MEIQMNFKKLLMASCVIAAASTTQADITIGVVTSSSGPVAMVGIPQKNSIALLPKKIGNENVRYIG